MIDGEYLVRAILDGGEEGIRKGLKLVQSRAQEKAPVRDIFRHGRGKQGHIQRGAERAETLRFMSPIERGWHQAHGAAPRMMTVSSAQRAGFLTVSRLGAHRGRAVVETPTEGVYKLATGVRKPGEPPRTVRGRPNSYAPVIQSPFGFIGGQELRHWGGEAGAGHLAISTIKLGKQSFNLEDALSSKGRYEVRTGRAVTTHGEVSMVGGRLRDSIEVVPPVRNGLEVYGFVKAAAADPGRNYNYAKAQEFGTRHNKAQPFLRPALRESHDQITRLGIGRKRGTLQQALQTSKRPIGHAADGGITIPMELDFRSFRVSARKLLGGL